MRHNMEALYCNLINMDDTSLPLEFCKLPKSAKIQFLDFLVNIGDFDLFYYLREQIKND